MLPRRGSAKGPWGMTALLQIDGLVGAFRGPRRTVRAVDDVSFTLDAGAVMALVGESGCGKTTLARAIVQLEPPTAGHILLDGQATTGRTARLERARRIQMVFQDPFG